MAKEIKPETESSAARFLTMEGSMPPVDHAGENGNPSTALPGTPTGSALDVPRLLQKVKREFVLTRETDAVINEVVNVLRETSDTRLSSSHVLRGLARLLMQHLPAIRNAAVAMGPRRLPATGSGHALARLAFERYLAQVFKLAISGRVEHPAVGDGSE